MFPWLVFLKRSGKKLSDIEYLSIKEFDGKLVQNDGTRTTTGDLATLTAGSGKDMYLASAKIIVVDDDVNNVKSAIITLDVNGVVLATAELGGTSETQGSFIYEFATKGFKVAATEIIKLEVTANTGTADVYGELICFEEDTGASPAV